MANNVIRRSPYIYDFKVRTIIEEKITTMIIADSGEEAVDTRNYDWAWAIYKNRKEYSIIIDGIRLTRTDDRNKLLEGNHFIADIVHEDGGNLNIDFNINQLKDGSKIEIFVDGFTDVIARYVKSDSKLTLDKEEDLKSFDEIFYEVKNTIKLIGNLLEEIMIGDGERKVDFGIKFIYKDKKEEFSKRYSIIKEDMNILNQNNDINFLNKYKERVNKLYEDIVINIFEGVRTDMTIFEDDMSDTLTEANSLLIYSNYANNEDSKVLEKYDSEYIAKLTANIDVLNELYERGEELSKLYVELNNIKKYLEDKGIHKSYGSSCVKNVDVYYETSVQETLRPFYMIEIFDTDNKNAKSFDYSYNLLSLEALIMVNDIVYEIINKPAFLALRDGENMVSIDEGYTKGRNLKIKFLNDMIKNGDVIKIYAKGYDILEINVKK